jgi:hypothetical protein
MIGTRSPGYAEALAKAGREALERDNPPKPEPDIVGFDDLGRAIFRNGQVRRLGPYYKRPPEEE